MQMCIHLLQGLILVASLAWVSPPAEAYNLNDLKRDVTHAPKKHVDKASKWLEVQSGARKWSNRVKDALKSATGTSDKIGSFIDAIKWPLVASAYFLAIWLARRALGYSPRPQASRQQRDVSYEPPDRHIAAPPSRRRPLAFNGRALLIALGASAFYTGFYMLHLYGNERYSGVISVSSYFAIGALFSLGIGVFLCWIPFRRALTCLIVGFLMPIVVALAYHLMTPSQAPV